MTSESTQVAPSTNRAGAGKGKGGKKGSRQEAPSSNTETLLARLPPAEKVTGVAVADAEATLKELRCTTILITRKHEDRRIRIEDYSV